MRPAPARQPKTRPDQQPRPSKATVRMNLSATILITTKDRKSELLRALESSVMQLAVTEVLLFDDGSSDGTSEMVRRRFPMVRCERSERSLGIVGARNRGVALATGLVVITIDDDCVFQSPYTVQRTLEDFGNPRVGAVAIPHINVNSSSRIHSSPPSQDRVFVVPEFSSGASAVRRDLFLALGGFNPALWRQGEEADLCTRMLDAGFVTRCGSADPILHYESPNRNQEVIQGHRMRSNLIYCWHNVPAPYVPAHMAGTIWKTMASGFSQGLYRASFEGLLAGVKAITASTQRREPVSIRAYKLMRRLRHKGPLPLELIEPSLP